MHFHRSSLKLLAAFATLMLSIASFIPVTDNIETNVTTNISSQTATAIPNTSTPLPISSPTSSSTPTIQIEDRCLSLEESLPLDLQLEGVWVRQSGKPYLENLEENIKYRIPLYGGGILNTYYKGTWSVSPNGEWLAYIDAILDTSEEITRTNANSLRVIHSSGYFLSMDYWPAGNQVIQGWIDNKNLLLRVNHRNIVLNPFTGKWYELLKPDWLEEKSDGGPWFNPYQFSPHLDYIIENLEDHSEIKSFKSGERLFGDSTLGFFGITTWSLDGSMLFLTTDEGKTIHVLRDGKEISKVNLVEIGVLSKSIYDQIDTAIWTLNKQRLLLGTDMKSFVVDIDENKIYNICFIDENISKDWAASGEFFSSQNGQYIILKRSIFNEKPYVQRIDILIDIENLRAYRLPEVLYKDYIGWLALPETTEK